MSLRRPFKWKETTNLPKALRYSLTSTWFRTEIVFEWWSSTPWLKIFNPTAGSHVCSSTPWISHLLRFEALLFAFFKLPIVFCTVLAPRARGRYLSRSPCGQFGQWGNGIESGSLRNESEFKLGTFLFSKIEKHRMIAPNWGKQNGNLHLQVLATFDSHRTLFPMRTFTQATYTCVAGHQKKMDFMLSLPTREVLRDDDPTSVGPLESWDPGPAMEE